MTRMKEGNKTLLFSCIIYHSKIPFHFVIQIIYCTFANIKTEQYEIGLKHA